MKPKKITQMAIYPPVGIARVGNSDEYYIASDIPGKAAVAEGGYKDGKGRVKKQVVRFRIYGLDDKGAVVKEITARDGAEITWNVHVANRKAGWYQFMNALDLPGQAIPGAFRNQAETDREKLIIDPGARQITGINQSGEQYRFTGGKFYDMEVPLGEVRTDDEGRLLVFGGDGHSASLNNAQAVTFANNDGWHDDTSDGPVFATVTYNGSTYEAAPAMVAVTPPNFGQGLFAVVTMYDVVYDLYARSGWLKAPKKPIFWDNIYPILERTVQHQWVNGGFYMLFGQNSPSDFTSPKILKQLADPSDKAKKARTEVFAWYRKPDGDNYEPAKIPPFYGDAFGDYAALPNVDLPLTQTQYAWLEQWANGNFEVGAPAVDAPFDSLSPQQQVESLIKAPLEECLGGPFHPGIEITWPFRNLIMWEKPWRLKVLPEGTEPGDDYGLLLSPQIALANGGPIDGSGPGSLTRWLGVPWQTDEASCLSGYTASYYLTLPSFWAARVPNFILSADSFKRLTDNTLNIAQRLKHFDYRQNWLRDFSTQSATRINAMVQRWHELGIIVEHPLPEKSNNEFLPSQLWVESGRGYYEDTDPTFEQVKIAEHANMPMLKAAISTLDAIEGPSDDTARPRRKRQTFRRNEL
jgi:hypothetical protein